MENIIPDDDISLSFSNQNVLVIDNGSYELKAGFSKDDSPRALIPTLVGIPRNEITVPEYGQRANYVGRSVIGNEHFLDITCPLSKGIVVDWDVMEDVYYHMYYEELMIPPENFPVLHTEIVDNPRINREKHIEMMFESFSVPSTALVSKAALALYRNGYITGMVVDSGYDYTKVVPVYEGYPMRYNVQNIWVGGMHVTQYLAQLLRNRYKINFDSPKDLEVVKNIKEKLCFCAMDFEKELTMYSEHTKQKYKLPDGRTIEISSEAFRSPEIFFKPELFNIESEDGGVHEMINKAINTFAIDEQPIMYRNICLAGGNSLIRYTPERLEYEMSQMTADQVHVIANPERRYCTWIGGSVLASSFNFERVLITKESYEEIGPAVAHLRSII